MTNYKTDVVIVGLGSIGQRHARLLSKLGASVTTISRRSGVGSAENLADVISLNPHALLVVATETASHFEILKSADAAGHLGPVVVEKPIALKAAELAGWQPNRPLWVAYNMRYHPLVQAFKNALADLDEPVLSVTAHAGQYLGDWRPDRKISDTYSAHMSQGGGVLRDLSHEIDLITWFWGQPESVSALGGRLGNITVDSDDCWNILLRCGSGVNVSLGLNYMDRPARRFLHALSNNTTISADLINGTLSINGDVSSFPSDRDDSYIAMWKDILSACEKGSEPQACKFIEGLNTLSLIEACEKSAKSNEWVKP